MIVGCREEWHGRRQVSRERIRVKIKAVFWLVLSNGRYRVRLKGPRRDAGYRGMKEEK
jgi:hypothetical protein